MLGGKPETTTQISKVELPGWVDTASQDNYTKAQEIAAKPFQEYTGDMVADFDPATLEAFKLFQNTLGSGNPSRDTAADLFSRSTGSLNKADSSLAHIPGIARKSESVLDQTGQYNDLARVILGRSSNLTDEATGMFRQASKGIAGMDRDEYMNPFINEVENKALGALDKARIQSLMHNADRATAAKAFGGDRAAVVDAVTNAETAEQAGILSAGLRKQGFDTASSLMQGDVNNMLASGQGILSAAGGMRDTSAGFSDIVRNLIGTSAGYSGIADQFARAAAGHQANAAGYGATGRDFLSHADSVSGQRLTDFQGLLGIGTAKQDQTQKELTAARSEWDRMQNHDLEQLNILNSTLGQSPYGKTENIEKTTEGGSQGPDIASLGMGILSLLFGLSDENEKKDKEKVATDPITGIPIYKFRYKGQSRKTPKTRGPMAQDVAKVFPGAVKEIGGKKHVRGDVLGALANV